LTDTVKVVLAGPAVKLPDGESVSQLLLVQLCNDTSAVALILVCAVTANICAAGAAPAARALNDNVDALSVSSPVDVASTFIVTFAVCVTEPAVIEIVPLQVVPAVIPD
jgi:hypothetical protein